MQCKARRYYPVETNGNIWDVYTDIRPRVARKMDQWKLPYRRKDQPGARNLGKERTVLIGTSHDDRELFKWNSQNEPAAFTSAQIKIGGTTKKPYAVHKAFLYRQSTRLRPLFARQFDTDLPLRPSQIAKYHDRIMEFLKYFTKHQFCICNAFTIIEMLCMVSVSV